MRRKPTFCLPAKIERLGFLNLRHNGGLAFLAAGLLSGFAAFGAQRPSTGYGPAAPPDLAPYGGLAQVPPNGCVWENVVYSNGAVIPRPYASLPECDRGTWTMISPADAIFGRTVPETPDGDPRPRD